MGFQGHRWISVVFFEPNHCLLGPEELVKGIYEFKFFLKPIRAEYKKY
jgi:hypothetical protein